MTPDEEEVAFNKCEHCGGANGEHQPIEVMGDGDNFEWDVVGYKRCPEENYE